MEIITIIIKPKGLNKKLGHFVYLDKMHCMHFSYAAYDCQFSTRPVMIKINESTTCWHAWPVYFF